MKYFKNKKFNIPKFLFIFVGLLSCAGALYIQETLSYFYTSYGFANTFQTPALGSAAVYQKFTNPTPVSSSTNQSWRGKPCTKELFFENTSDEGGPSQYLRVAYIQVMGAGTSGEDYPRWFTSAHKPTHYFGAVFSTDGLYNGYRGPYAKALKSSWAQYGEWYYYKTPVPPGKKLQITDSMGNPDYSRENETTNIYKAYTLTFIFETLPTTVSDEEFQNAWGVSKSELGLS